MVAPERKCVAIILSSVDNRMIRGAAVSCMKSHSPANFYYKKHHFLMLTSFPTTCVYYWCGVYPLSRDVLLRGMCPPFQIEHVGVISTYTRHAYIHI